MHPTTRRRNLLLHEMAQCLMRLVEAATVASTIDALVGFLQGLSIAWHTIDVFADGRLRKHVSSFRCPRGFAPFVTRLGFVKRPDGTYQGSFAESTLVLVKATGAAPGDQSLVCAIGLPKNSPLNDGTVLACIGGLIHEALSRVVWFEANARRAAALGMVVEQDGDLVAVFDAKGHPVEQHASGDAVPLPPELLAVAVDAARRPSRAPRTPAVAIDGHVYDTRSQWITTERPFENRYLCVRVRARPSAPIAVVERLKSYGLSRRESQVAELVFAGTTNKRIAAALFISPDTVKTHCRHIFGKLGISRRTEFLRVIADASSPAALPPAGGAHEVSRKHRTSSTVTLSRLP